MCEQQRLIDIIARAYDAALDLTLWPEVLASIAQFVDGQVAGLLVKDAAKKCVTAHYQAGGDPHYMRLYAETYSQLGPVATALFSDARQVVSIPQLVAYEGFCRGRFYQEWARPQGWVDVAIGVLDKSAGGGAYLSVARDQASGMVDDEMRRRIALIVPHVRRSVLIAKTIDFRQAEAATFADVLDGLSAGLFLLDSAGRVVHANTAAAELLEAGALLRSTSGRLAASDARFDQALRETLTVVGTAGHDVELGAKGTALPLTAPNGEHYVAHLLPLRSGDRQLAGITFAAGAALFVRKAALDYPSPAQVISEAYNLTPAELRVLLGIVEIGGVPEVAAALGVADATVKTHVSRLFEKTGTGRQADLVKLVAGFSMPLTS
jgi:DNA-binding CsgD family transcriptional regulator/PAS domain-containing protein